jgi:hypothetical protein
MSGSHTTHGAKTERMKNSDILSTTNCVTNQTHVDFHPGMVTQRLAEETDIKRLI